MNFTQAFLQHIQRQGDQAQSWRARAWQAWQQLALPNADQEFWRAMPFARMQYDWQPSVARNAINIPEHLFLANSDRIVFVDGFFAPEYSQLPSLAAPSYCGSMATALITQDAHALQHCEQLYAEHGFAALNHLLWRDGLYLRLAKGVRLTRPIQCLMVSTRAQQLQVLHHYIDVAEAAAVELLEHYVQLHDESAWTLTQTHLHCGEESQVDYHSCCLETGVHVGQLYCTQQARSCLTQHALATNAALLRRDVHSRLLGQAAQINLQGFLFAKQQQYLDQHIEVQHLAARSQSQQNVRGLADDRARLVLHSKLLVQEGAPHCEALQKSKHLLLSEQAEINTYPQLEIFVDEVSCQHGTSIGDLDADALFYLQARGISLAEAKQALIYGFAAQAFATINTPVLRQFFQHTLCEHLQHDWVELVYD